MKRMHTIKLSVFENWSSLPEPQRVVTRTLLKDKEIVNFLARVGNVCIF